MENTAKPSLLKVSISIAKDRGLRDEQRSFLHESAPPPSLGRTAAA
jgi:hypothetical protein